MRESKVLGVDVCIFVLFSDLAFGSCSFFGIGHRLREFQLGKTDGTDRHQWLLQAWAICCRPPPSAVALSCRPGGLTHRHFVLGGPRPPDAADWLGCSRMPLHDFTHRSGFFVPQV